MSVIESASYRRTDLACEAEIDKSAARGVSFYEYERGRARVERMIVGRGDGERAAGRAAGTYVTFTASRPWMWDEDDRQRLVSELAASLSDAVLSSTGRRPDEDFPILVCGLGNRFMTADAIGPKTADKVIVTSALKSERPELYARIGCCRVAAISPGVAASTGVDAVDVVKGVADVISPSVVILIDALAARSCSRLASTIQIADTGISPGSGIGNSRRSIDKDAVGVPVVTIGVPTVVDSSTLVWDALDAAGVDTSSMPDSLREVLTSGRRFYVAPNDSDVLTEEMSTIIAEAINVMCRAV